MNNKILSLALATSFFALSILPAKAEEFIFVRPGDPDRIFKRNEALVIELPASLSQDDLNTLFLELDGVDITQMVALNGTQVVFTPASPYASGSHALRLVRMGANGKLVEINRWSFMVAGGVPPVEQSASLKGNIDATYSHMAWNNYDREDEPNRGNLAMQGKVNGNAQTHGWQLSARGNGFINSERELNPNGDRGEIGEYLLRAEKPDETLSTTLNLGHHKIEASNLLIDRFYRRGASAKFDFLHDRAGLAGFIMNPSSITGNRNLSGFDEGESVVRGLHARARPFAKLGDRLAFEGSFYSGQKGITGNGTAGSLTERPDASGYQLGLTSSLIENYLDLSTQYSESDFDPDGRHTGVGEENDHAYDVSFTFFPFGGKIAKDGSIRQWKIDAGYQQTGTGFDTLLNSALESDRKTWKLASAYARGGLSLDAEAKWLTDNVNDDPDKTRDGALSVWAQTSYAPEKEIWGMPVFSLGAALSDEERRRTPAGYVGDGLDRKTGSLNGGVALGFETISLSLNHTYTKFIDDIDTTAEYESHFTDVGAEYQLSERVTLKPGLQFEYLDEDSDGASRATHASLGGEFILIPQKLWNNSDYSMLLNDGNTPAGREFRAETEFTWLLKTADVNSPGLALAVAGHYDNEMDTDDSTDEEDEDARVFIRLKSSLAFSR